MQVCRTCHELDRHRKLVPSTKKSTRIKRFVKIQKSSMIFGSQILRCCLMIWCSFCFLIRFFMDITFYGLFLLSLFRFYFQSTRQTNTEQQLRASAMTAGSKNFSHFLRLFRVEVVTIMNKSIPQICNPVIPSPQ